MITLQFSCTTGLEAEAIRLFERGWPSHVDVVLEDGSLLGARSDSVGGQPPGVRIRPAGYLPFSRYLVVNLAATPEIEAGFLAFLHAQVGKPYDELAIVAFAVGRDWRDPFAWFCSELVAAALEVSRWFAQLLATVANEITPRDLLMIVSPWAITDLKRTTVMKSALLQFFAYAHLPAHLQIVSQPFHELAQDMDKRLPSNPEKTVALRKLLEAKDCAVRAVLFAQPTD